MRANNLGLQMLNDARELARTSGLSEDICYNLLNPDDENYLVQAIKQANLRTPDQRAWMYKQDISIEDMLNGRVEGEENQSRVEQIFQEWNKKLGRKLFGS